MGLEIGTVFNINIDFVFLEVSQVFEKSGVFLVTWFERNIPPTFISIKIQNTGFYTFVEY